MRTSTILHRRPIPGFDSIPDLVWRGVRDVSRSAGEDREALLGGDVRPEQLHVLQGIDNASGHLEAFNGDNSRVNYRNVPAEKGVGAYDQPFNNTTSVVWELPYGKGRKWGRNRHPRS